jgi:hypothetical protein
MKKVLLGGAATLAIAAAAFSGSANAACNWNGYNWDCAAPQGYYQPYAYQRYYGYAQPQSDYYVSYPQWNSGRYPGPRTN